jgi:hypothetical protein
MTAPLTRQISGVIGLTAVVGCTGPLVNVAPVPPTAYSEGAPTRGEACGMLVFSIVPVSVNDRVERAYAQALAGAGATSLTDTSITESWYFTPIGPEVCTKVEGLAITRSGESPVAPAPQGELRKNSR